VRRHVRASLVAVCLSILVIVAVAGCSRSSSGGGTAAPSGTSAGATTVVEKNFAFDPSSASVKVGDVVTFSNQDTAPHNVKIDNRELGQQSPGQDVKWTATKDGTRPRRPSRSLGWAI
jgi:plastocyanin